VNDPRFVDVPMILETPKGKDGDEDLDAINLRILRRLCAEGPGPAGPASPARRIGRGRGAPSP
jgi:deoxyribonuclease IV